MEVTILLASIVVGVLIVGHTVRLVRRAKAEKKQGPAPLLGVVYPTTTAEHDEAEDKKRAKRALHDRDTES